jgi:hypothetical protein
MKITVLYSTVQYGTRGFYPFFANKPGREEREEAEESKVDLPRRTRGENVQKPPKSNAD